MCFCRLNALFSFHKMCYCATGKSTTFQFISVFISKSNLKYILMLYLFTTCQIYENGKNTHIKQFLNLFSIVEWYKKYNETKPVTFYVEGNSKALWTKRLFSKRKRIITLALPVPWHWDIESIRRRRKTFHMTLTFKHK